MISHQTKNSKNAGFTLVEVMVVILIISILVALGNYGDFTQRREKARMEELAVQLTALMDQEKTNTLLGKTESGAIVRQRKIELSFVSSILTYKSLADLAEDIEDTYCGISSRCTNVTPVGGTGTNYALITKTWQFYDPNLNVSLFECDTNPNTGTALSAPTDALSIELQGDAMAFATHPSNKHIAILLSRDGFYREIHIDRRTGVIYEREGASTGIFSCI